MAEITITDNLLFIQGIDESSLLSDDSVSRIVCYLEKGLPYFRSFCLEELGLDKFDLRSLSLSFSFCDDNRIQQLNRDYRQKNKTTDVLSFPIYESLRPDSDDYHSLMKKQALEIGDIFICVNKAISQAKEFNVSFEEEVIHLFVHGLLHLLGFDHEISEKEEEIMNSHEQMLLARIAGDNEV